MASRLRASPRTPTTSSCLRVGFLTVALRSGGGVLACALRSGGGVVVGWIGGLVVVVSGTLLGPEGTSISLLLNGLHLVG